MKMRSYALLRLSLFSGASLLLSSCSTLNFFKKDPTSATPQVQADATPAKPENPHPPGSYEAFKWGSYPGTTRSWKDDALLAQANSSNTKVKIDLSDQRGFLLVNDAIAMDYRVSTGRSSHKTPTGSYKITEKIRDKRSNLYGRIVNSAGKTVKSGADSRKHKVPSGGKFIGASMPYWMRLTNGGVGMHQGNVGRRYASHGCIRTHRAAVPIVFAKTKVGTPVTIQP